MFLVGSDGSLVLDKRGARARAISLAMLMALLCACDHRDDSVVELGRIEYYNGPLILDAPDSVAVGQSFVVTVETYGGGCISYEDTEVEFTGEGAEFWPFDRRSIPGKNEACGEDLTFIPHEATLVFDTAGSKKIRIHGRRVSLNEDDVVQIPFTVVVQ